MFVLWILRHRRALNLLFWPYFRNNFKPSAGQETVARTKISLQLLLVLSASITHTKGWLKLSIPGLISPKNQRSRTANIQFTKQTSPWCCSPRSPTESSAWRRCEIFCWKHAFIFPQKNQQKTLQSMLQISYAPLLAGGIFFCWFFIHSNLLSAASRVSPNIAAKCRGEPMCLSSTRSLQANNPQQHKWQDHRDFRDAWTGDLDTLYIISVIPRKYLLV